MTEIIAERPVYGIFDGTQIRVLARLWTPEQISDEEWRCRFTFEADSRSIALEDGWAGGIDAMQALIQALQGIGVTLDDSGIEWDAFPDDAHDQPRELIRDHFFPHPTVIPSYLGSAFRKRMESYVESETTKEVHAQSEARRARGHSAK